MESLVISALETPDEAIEIVERNGLGHPDTICDALAEALSRNLCREYRQRFGTILHHNVDNVIRIDAFAEMFGGFSIGSNADSAALGVDRDSEIVPFDFEERNPRMMEVLQLAVTGAKR